MTRADRWCPVIAGLLLTGIVNANQADPRAWLDRMNDAVRELDYEGRFVVQSDDRLDALYLVHRVDDGIEKERVVSLTGKPREIIRSDEAVACLVPGQERHINVGRRPVDRSLSPLNGISSEQLAESYRMEMLDEEWVAGRATAQVLIEPLDGYRYGYRLFIDKKTALPLRSVMFDNARNVVSQMMFVEVKIGDAVTPIERDISAMQLARVEDQDRMPRERLAEPAWQVSETPPGFRLNLHRRRPVGDGELEHFVYSDGLASLSVYVQPATGEGLSGVSRFGAAKAVGRSLPGHEIVVVGEVPLDTLRWFADRVEPSTR